MIIMFLKYPTVYGTINSVFNYLKGTVFQVNMLFFLSIIRTLVAKLKAPDMHGNEINHHR